MAHQVNLAHEGMGDVVGGILADCLVGLPLMRELNLRDNRLTDKGLMPLVKVRMRCRTLIKMSSGLVDSPQRVGKSIRRSVACLMISRKSAIYMKWAMCPCPGI